MKFDKANTQPGRMRRLGYLLSGDLTVNERKKFMTVGSDFLSALATDLNMSDVAITRNETSITGYSGQIRLSGRPDSGVCMVIDLEQNFLTYQEEQSCLFCRPANTAGLQARLCTSAGIPMFQGGHYDHLLKLLRCKCEGGEALEHGGAA